MTPTIEEVKKVAIELDFFELADRPDYFCVGLEELQAFAQHYIKVGEVSGVNEMLSREFGDLDAFDKAIATTQETNK